MSYIIILCDSRGKGLRKFVERNSEINSVIIERAFGGADFPKLEYELVKLIPSVPSTFKDKTVIISAGICSLTTKTRTPGKHEVSYVNSRLHQLKPQIDSIISLCSAHDLKLIFTGIYSASLEKSAAHFAECGKQSVRSWSIDDTAKQQFKLETDINSINKYISERAQNCDFSYVNLQRSLSKRSTKTYKGKKRVIQYISYDELTDGIHPSDKLKDELFTKIMHAYHFLHPISFSNQ